MKRWEWRGLVAGAAALATVAAFGAGCSSNPPCETDLAAVEAARKSAADAEARLAELERQKRELEEQLAAENVRRADLERRKAELEAKIAEMSK
jgi:hypothetical protein